MKNKLILIMILGSLICGRGAAGIDGSLVEVPDGASVQSSDGLGSLLSSALDAIRRGDLEKAIAFVDEFLVDHPATAPSEEILGTCFALQGDVEKGLAHLIRSIQLNPYQGTAYVKIGDIFLAQERFEEAMKMFRLATSINPEDRLPFQRIGLLFEREGYVERAIINFENGLRGASPDYLGIKLNLARLYNETKQFEKTKTLLSSVVSGRSENVAVRMLMGAAALGLGDRAEALKWFEGVGEVAGGDRTLLMSVSMAYQELGDLEKSLAVLERGRLLADDDLEYSKRLLHIYMEAGSNAEALALVKSLATRENAHPDLIGMFASVYQNNLLFEEAEAVLQRGVAEHPESTDLTFRLGLHYALVQKYQQAVDTLKTVLEEEPENASALRAISMAEERLGNRSDAIEYADRLVSTGDGGVADKFLLATLLETTGRADEALELYQEVLVTAPRHAGALNNLANYYLRLGNLEKAEELATRAAQEAPAHPMILDTLGWIQFNAGDPEAAIATLSRAAEQVGFTLTHRFHLAASYAKAGRPEEAIVQLEQVLESSAEFSDRPQAEELYDSLLSRRGTAGRE